MRLAKPRSAAECWRSGAETLGAASRCGPGSPSPRAAIAVAAVLAACGQGNQYVAPPLPKVAVAKPAKQPITRYLEATGNTAAVNSADLVARVTGLHRDDQLRGRRAREEGRPPVHDRARALQGEARSGPGVRSVGGVVLQAGAGRVRTLGRADQAEGHDPGVVRFGARHPRRRAIHARQRALQHAPRRRSTTTTRRCGRRSTASCRRARSRSGPMSAAAARRPCSPPSCSSIRSG